MRTLALLSALALTATLTACSDSDAPELPVAEDLQSQASDAASAIGDFASSQIVEFKDSMQAQLDTLNNNITALEQRVGNFAEDSQAEAQQIIDDLKQRRDDFAQTLDNASADSPDAWTELRTGLGDSWNELVQAFDSAAERFGIDSE